MRIWNVVAAAVVVAFMPAAALAIPQPGKPAPPFSLPSPAGKPVTLDALKGKPAYINFYASWCAPCNDEAASIGQLRARYAKQGLRVLGIDELEAAAQGAAFQKKHGNPYSLIAIDENGAVGKTYGTIAMPVHVFIDRRGIVTTFRIGEMSPGEIEAAIKGSLK